MDSVIELNNIETLPNNTLAILKDNLGENDIYSLCLKDDVIDYHSPLDFRLGFILVKNVPICILMIKIKNKIYKTLISLNFIKELDYLKNLLSSQAFNLFLFTKNKANFVYRIENKQYIDFSRAISAVETNMQNNLYDDIILSKEDLLNKYTDEELWKLAK